MRALLVQPDYPRQAQSPEELGRGLLPARSLIELASILQSQGHQVTVLDSLTAMALVPGPRLDFEGALGRLLERERYGAVGIAVYTPTRREARQLARQVKQNHRLTPVIAGGPHAARLGKSLLESWPEIDYVCLGAAEKSLPELVSSLEGKGPPAFRIKHLAYRAGAMGPRQNGKSLFDVDLASLPPPDYRSYLEGLPEGRIERAYVQSARGCVHWCNFCSNLWKRMLPAGPQRVADEVEWLVKHGGARTVIFYDDCFGKDPDHGRAVLKAILARKLEVRLQAVTTFDSIDPRWLELFKEAGGRDIIMGLESGSKKLRKRMNKHFEDGLICRSVEEVRGQGLKLAVSVMFGFPAEEEQDVRETYRLLKKIGPEQVMSSVFTISPGDLLFEFGVSLGGIIPDDWEKEDNRVLSGLSQPELERAAAMSVFFDREFTREVIVPEHDGADFITGAGAPRTREIIEAEQERWK